MKMAMISDNSSFTRVWSLMSIDLKAQTYPAQLPLPKDPSKPMNPMAAMASVGFTYTDANGNEWAGPATEPSRFPSPHPGE